MFKTIKEVLLVALVVITMGAMLFAIMILGPLLAILSGIVLASAFFYAIFFMEEKDPKE